VGVETQFDGMITGVNYTPEGPLLLVGNKTVKMSDVRKIVDPSLKKDDQKVDNKLNQDLKVDPKTTENKEVKKLDAKPATTTLASNLDQISMSRGMLNKVEKQSGKELAP
jgi:flagellar basal-body rod modification protein FlgD